MGSKVLKAYEDGQESIRKGYLEKEGGKKGCLRAGQTGMADEFGNIAGQCAAQAWLRSQGVEYNKPDAKTMIMFDGGNANEDAWLKVLKAGWDGPILCEEEIPTRWLTDSETPVTGRPDVVLCDKDEKPQLGIELKQCMSFWSVRDVLFEGNPKTAHLLQAAHYSWQLGIPFELWYTGRSEFAIMADWVKRGLPKYLEPGSEHLEYAFYRQGDINPRTGKPMKHRINKQEYEIALAQGEKVFADALKTRPFIQGFLLELREGTLWYQNAIKPNAEWVRTVIKIDDIKKFYNTVSELKKVPKPPINIKPTGEEGGFKIQDYCSLGPLCCAYNTGKDIGQWKDRVEIETKNK